MIVFVHGVPETAELWDGVRSHIDADSVAVSMPGFGCERPASFGGTKEDYAKWLAGELAKIDAPIDLVGHDWGAGLTYRVVMAYPDGIRSWAADVANVAHPDYEWHDFAKLWQTPEQGEAFFAGMLEQEPTDRAAVFEASGVPKDDAVKMASRVDQTMADSILGLYRSATPNPYADWGPFRPTSAPGAILFPTEDPFGDEKMSGEVAEMFGARTLRLEGLGHWWPLQDPAASARALQGFWDHLD